MHAALSKALAQVVREKPAHPLRMLAQLISPESYVAPPPETIAEATGAAAAEVLNVEQEKAAA